MIADNIVHFARVLRDADGVLRAVFAERRVGFFEVELHLLQDGKALKVPMPLKSSRQGCSVTRASGSLRPRSTCTHFATSCIGDRALW